MAVSFDDIPRLGSVEKIDGGGIYGICSIDDDFMNYYIAMSDGQVSMPSWAAGSHLTVFWHHNAKADSIGNYIGPPLSGAGTDPKLEMLQERIKSVMNSVKFCNDSMLLQFWAPIQSQSHKVLTSRGQPFGLVDPPYKGLCRYRKRCLKQTYCGNAEDSQLGPPGRVFKRGYLEFCLNIQWYTNQEFPLRDYARRQCGIEGYWALPLFELCEQRQQCLGVLEYVGMGYTQAVNDLNRVLPALEEANLKCPSSYFHKCNEVSRCFDIGRSAGYLDRHDEALENTGREELQLQSPPPPAMVEMNVTNDKTNTVFTKKHSSVTPSLKHDRVEPSRRVHTNAEARITWDVLALHFGRNLVDAAAILGVSRSTLKRICRGHGISRWPSHKRKKVDHHIHPSPRLAPESIVDVGEEVIQESAGGHEIINALGKEAAAPMLTVVNGYSTAPRDEIDNKDTMIVKATCGENIVKFPLPCNSGIEYLSHEIAKRFKLKVGSFTIRYKDEDSEWIMIPCDEDLRYLMETSRQSSIRLLVFPVTP